MKNEPPALKRWILSDDPPAIKAGASTQKRTNGTNASCENEIAMRHKISAKS
jgi:hypothetical protein